MDQVASKGNPIKCIPARYMLAILGSIGMGIVYGLKVNLSVAMVGMLNHTALAELAAQGQDGHGLILENQTSAHERDEECQPSNSTVKAEDGPFVWSEPLQGVILSCYFWGYFISQIPGGRIAELFSAKWVMFFSVFINVICTLLTPVMANIHYTGVIAMRIGEGIGGGVTFPAVHVMLSHWAPPAERGFMAALVYAGTALGTVLSMLGAGILSVLYGWEYVFYVMGGLSVPWCCLWVVFIRDKPEEQAYIEEEERSMIQKALGTSASQEKIKMPIPWKAILTSPAFLAILVAHTCSNWGWYMLLIELPFYMKQVLKFNITENAVLTAFPFLTLWFFSLGLGKTLDVLRNRGIITTTTSRKIGTLFASLVPMLCLLALCFIGCDRTLGIVLMGAAVTGIGGMFCGFLSNHIDIAPNFAGTLMALTNTMATLSGIIVPLFVGYITHGNQTISAWRIIFYVTIALYAVEIIVYTIFGSAVEQPWNKPHKTMEDLEIERSERQALGAGNQDDNGP